MIKLLKKFFRKEKRIAFLDGDQPLAGMMRAYDLHVKGTNTETHLVRLLQDGNEPKCLRKIDPKINKMYLQGYRTGKEATDKFIGQWIQKALTEGFNHITVVSSDYDFIDTFKMCAQLNELDHITFRLIVSMNTQQIEKYKSKVTNVEIIDATKTN